MQKKMNKKARQNVVEHLLTDAIKEEPREVVALHPNTYKERSAMEVVGVPHRKKRLELAELLNTLKNIIESVPEGKLKYSDVIRAVEVAAKLEGYIDRPKEEKHLHVHGAELSRLTEAQLQAELERLQAGRVEGSMPQRGNPEEKADL